MKDNQILILADFMEALAASAAPYLSQAEHRKKLADVSYHIRRLRETVTPGAIETYPKPAKLTPRF